MRVLVVNSMAPFIWGGAEELAANLQKNLIAAGHQAEILRIPFQWEPPSRIPSQMLMVRGFELENVDHVIALRFPAYLIRHPRKTLWLLHQYRQAYDLHDSGQSNLTADDEGEQIRGLIRSGDAEAFGEARYIFANSDVTRRRLLHYNGVNAEVLLPPMNDPELFSGGKPRGYIFCGGRVNKMKRQYLLIEALAKTRGEVRLVIAGPPDSAQDAETLRSLAAALNVMDRVTFDLRLLSRREIANYVNGAAACAYVPVEEDSLSYVAMEAAAARKAIIATSDSGGVLGLVRHGQTGLVAASTPAELARVMDKIFASQSFADVLGSAAHDLLSSLQISWPKTIETLLQ